MRGMKAFEAPRHKTPGAQNFAEGGLVKQLKGMFGLDEERNARIAEYKRQREAEKAAAAAAPAPAQEPVKAVTDYSSGGALRRREQAAGLKDGGPVRGPGTGTSDDVPDEVREGTYIMPTDSTKAIGEDALANLGSNKVPVNLSNGEFKLPPEQVHAIGVQALNQMKDATHTPSSTEAAKGMKPELFFEGGGDVKKRREPGIFPGNHPDAGANIYANVGLPSSPPSVPGPSALYMADRAQEIGDQWKAGNVAGAVGTGVRTAVQGLGMYGVEAADKTVSPVISAGQRLIGGVLGTDTPSGTVKPAAVPTAPPVVQPQTSVSERSPSGPVLPGASQSTAARPGSAGGSLPAADTPNAASTGNDITRIGNSYSGQNITAGFTVNGAPMGASTGRPSAQNMAAAEALAGRSQQESMNRVAARGMGAVGGPGSGPVEPGSFTGGWSGVIGTDPAAGRERKAMVDALTTPMRGAQNGQLTASQRQGMAGLLEAERKDASSNRQADQTASTQRDIAAMRERGDTGRTAIREQGESARAGARNQLDARRVDLEERGQAPKLREAERMDALRTRYENAKPEERKAIAQQIRELQGDKVQQDVWAHSPGGQVVDPKTQQLITQPGVIYNRTTGETRADGSANRLPPIAENPAVQQIMNNTGLSREERAKQIRALGYQ